MVLQTKNFQKPDETQTPPNARVENIRIGDMKVLKVTNQPGWQWSKHQKSLAGTNSCQVHHFGVLVSGRLRVRADDGQEIELGPEDVVDIPPGHDGWVIGNEPAVFYWFHT
ncbi:cupin domain-containing protein [Candidatus Bathyarchaeota archaeon]|nr:cupin domain-containing protein [Candidatus Bathyarchaeota archaeon]